MPSEESATSKMIDEVKNQDPKVLQNSEIDKASCIEETVESNYCTESSQSASGSKRKLPSWMLTQNNEASSSTNKKTKTATTMEIETTDKTDQINTDNVPTSSIKIKTEPYDNIDDNPSSSSTNKDITPDFVSTTKVKTETECRAEKVKIEHSATANAISDDIKPAVKVEKADATSTTITRESCKYGIRCYRRNPMHRLEEAHPSDIDYRRPKFPAPVKGTPDCPFGNACYRRNPIHFQQYNHPTDTDFEQNYKNYRMRLRKRCQQQLNNPNCDDVASGNSSDLDDYDLDDPFIDDGDSEYMPSNDEEEDDEDDELQDENGDDDDDIDKAEE